MGRPKNFISADQIAGWCSRYLDGETLEQISETSGASTWTVRSRIVASGVTMRAPAHQVGDVPRWNKYGVNALAWSERYQGGETLEQIANDFDVSPTQVNYWLVKSGVQLRPSGSRPGYPGNLKERKKIRARASVLRCKYGLSLEAYEALLASQDGVCAICKKHPGSTPLVVDHCHQTKRVRGLLHMSCNASLGTFKDSPTLLRAAAEYLEKHRD